MVVLKQYLRRIKKGVVIIIVFFLVWFIHHQFYKKSNFVKNFIFETSDSLRTLIHIQNNGNKTVKFNFSLNNKFYSSINDFIRKNSKSKDSELFAIDLFNAQINSLVHESLFNEWGDLPLTTLNSKGFAICGRQSEIFSQILFNAGFSTRIFYLNGHIVSEIYYNHAWHIFDTDRKTFFRKDNKILSYKDLIINSRLIKELGLRAYMANITTFFDTYTSFFSTLNDNSFQEILKKNNDTFLINIPAKSSFLFPYYPDYKRDIFPYNTKAKLFLPKGFNNVVKNPLILIDVEGEGEVMYNNKVYIVPDEIELLKASIFNSHKFVEDIHIKTFSDTFALVYMLNPKFSIIFSKNLFSINASDSLKVEFSHKNDLLKISLFPIHIELLNHYSLKAFHIANTISLKGIKSMDDLYRKKLLTYCCMNDIDTCMVKNRLQLLKVFLDKPIDHYSQEAVFWGVLTVVLHGNNKEFNNLFLFNYKYQRYKKLLERNFLSTFSSKT